MESDEPHEGARLPRSAKHQEELSRLGRSWFAEAGAESEREAAEIEAWRKQHRKWTAFNKRSAFASDVDGATDDGNRE